MPSDYHASRMNEHGVLHPTPARPKLRDTCPVCGGQWAEVSDRDGRTYYPNLCGNYDTAADRTTSWTCLHCSTTWPRGDQAIYQEAGDG